jgi:hypothetical protein
MDTRGWCAPRASRQEEQKIDACLAEVAESALRALGWITETDDTSLQLALQLYFTSGHGAVFKAAERNSFEEIMRPGARVAS